MGLEGSDGSTQKRAKECGFDFYSVCSAHFPGNCRDCTENCLNEMKNNIKPKIFEGKKKVKESFEKYICSLHSVCCEKNNNSMVLFTAETDTIVV